MTRTGLIIAPHPDDESITGLLPLRLQEELGFTIWVLAATRGSKPARQAARVRELQAACGVLGFRLWGASAIQECLQDVRPDIVFFPHLKDAHPTHEETHRGVIAAMDDLGGQFLAAETEYWHPMRRPNILVEATEVYLAKLRQALQCHAGEVRRNDYATRLPAWMSDNVRRGTELVGGWGCQLAQQMDYATLYRLRIREEGRWSNSVTSGYMFYSDSARFSANQERNGILSFFPSP